VELFTTFVDITTLTYSSTHFGHTMKITQNSTKLLLIANTQNKYV
jgi:hypothetical protein